MSAPVFKFKALSATTGYVIDLRPDGSTTQPWTRCGALALGGIQGAAHSEIYVKPVSVADGEAAPGAPAALADLVGASKADVIYLHSLVSPTFQLGVQLPQGYDPTVHTTGYTHLLVWCDVAGSIKVSG